MLDAAARNILPAKDALDFELTGDPLLDRTERAHLDKNLFISLWRLRDSYDLLHVHVTLVGQLIVESLGKLHRLPVL